MNKEQITQLKIAARASVLKKLGLSLISPTEAKHQLMGLGVEERKAVEKVAKVVNDSIVDEV